MRLHHSPFIAFAIASAGCASLEPALDTSASPDASKAYISGSFTKHAVGGFAFVVKNLETEREYGLTLGNGAWNRTDVTKQVVTIEVPPGRYAVTSWYTYAALGKSMNGPSKKITNKYLARPFDLGPNAVRYLGDFSASTVHVYRSINESIRPERVSTRQARSAFLEAQPKFEGSAFACHMCVD